MDLIEYLRYRWAVFLAIFVVGLVVIFALGSGVGQSGYQAASKITVRPTTSQSSVSGFSLDRFITTEMGLMFDKDVLDAAVKGTGVSRGDLARGLSYKHSPGSDLVTLRVHLENRQQAITLANNVAKAYLADATARSEEPLQEQKDSLDSQIKTLNRQLSRSNDKIQAAAAAFTQANPDKGIPSPSILAPDDSVRADVLSGQIKELSGDLTDVTEQLSLGNQSSVASEATKASPAQHWSAAVYLSAGVALLLALLALAAIGLLLTRKVLSTTRWNAVTEGSGLQRILPMTARRGTRQERNVDRALLSLQDAGDAEAPTYVVHVPDRSRVAARNVEPLLTAMEENGLTLREVDGLDEAWAAIRSHGNGHRGSRAAESPTPGARVLLVASRHRATRDDAAAVVDRPGPHLAHVVPVLV